MSGEAPVYPHCRCETCVDHRSRIRREINRLLEQEKKANDRFYIELRRFVNDQEKFHNESVLRSWGRQ